MIRYNWFSSRSTSYHTFETSLPHCRRFVPLSEEPVLPSSLPTHSEHTFMFQCNLLTHRSLCDYFPPDLRFVRTIPTSGLLLLIFYLPIIPYTITHRTDLSFNHDRRHSRRLPHHRLLDTTQRLRHTRHLLAYCDDLARHCYDHRQLRLLNHYRTGHHLHLQSPPSCHHIDRSSHTHHHFDLHCTRQGGRVDHRRLSIIHILTRPKIEADVLHIDTYTHKQQHPFVVDYIRS